MQREASRNASRGNVLTRTWILDEQLYLKMLVSCLDPTEEAISKTSQIKQQHEKTNF